MQLRELSPRVKPVSLPEALNRHLSATYSDDVISIARYIEKGSALVTNDAIHALRQLLPALHVKLDGLDDSAHLRWRLEILATYFVEACNDDQAGSLAHRDVAFALLYFLKGFDRIPDSVPEYGLLDDAMIVQIVLQRHAPTLRAHWLRKRRLWPAEL